jgi:hypothetical protein
LARSVSTSGRQDGHGLEQFLLGVLGKQGHFHPVARLAGLLQDVLDALVGGGQGFGFRQGAEGGHRVQARRHPVDAGGGLDHHGLHLVRSAALVLQVDAQPVLHELEHVHRHAGGDLLGVELGPGQFQQLHQVQGQGLFHEHAQHAQGGPAQGEGILVAGGDGADAEDAHQAVQALGQGHGEADVVGGQFVAGEARLVVVGDGLPPRAGPRRRGGRSSGP